MDDYKQAFIEFMLRSDVLCFGDFTAKSGRKTPYFVNAGRYRTGTQISALARFYARAIMSHMDGGYDILFGPAYKGIPLCVATAMALHDDHARDVAFCFNRKEAKDHGEGGVLVGHRPDDGDRVLFIEDVTTAGTSIRETVPILQAEADVKLAGLVVAVDRMERGTGERGALDELSSQYHMKTFAIVSIEEIMEYLQGRELDGRVVLDDETHRRLVDYRQEFGV